MPAIREYVISRVTLVPDPDVALREPLVPEEPDDDRFILCAVRVKANAVVSGDRLLRRMSGRYGVPIWSASEFLTRFRTSRG